MKNFSFIGSPVFMGVVILGFLMMVFGGCGESTPDKQHRTTMQQLEQQKAAAEVDAIKTQKQRTAAEVEMVNSQKAQEDAKFWTAVGVGAATVAGTVAYYFSE